jgi:hypothetical protein
MSALLAEFRRRHDGIVIRTIHVAFALSIILHALLLVGRMPRLLSPSDDQRLGKSAGSLSVRLEPTPSVAAAPPPAPLLQSQPAQSNRASVPQASKSPPPERVLALERPSPARAVPPAPESPKKALLGEDLAAFVEARRRAREIADAVPLVRPSPPAPAETEQERINRAAAANLGLNRTPTFGTDRDRGGGIFQIARMGFNDAEFFFYGWNKAIRRNSRQMISVQRGNNPSTEVAVVRRMIQIIREHESEDFVWESHRLGRDVNLSARPRDNAGLEDFLMMEFFPSNRR